MYALKVQSKEVKSAIDKQIITKNGEWFWVMIEREGWVEATSVRIQENNPKTVPFDVKKFETKEKAEKFGRRWKGHPWWCQPNGDIEVVEIEPVYKQVIERYVVIEK